MSRSRILTRIDAVEAWTDARFPMDLVRELEQEFPIPRDRIITVMQEEIRRFQAAGTWERQLGKLARRRGCPVEELEQASAAFLGRPK